MVYFIFFLPLHSFAAVHSEDGGDGRPESQPGLKVLRLVDPQALARLGVPSVPVFVAVARYPFGGSLGVSLYIYDYEAYENTPLETLGPIFATVRVTLPTACIRVSWKVMRSTDPISEDYLSGHIPFAALC